MSNIKNQGTISVAWRESLPIWVNLEIFLDGVHVADFVKGESCKIPVLTGEHEIYIKRNWVGGCNRLRFTISPNEEKEFFLYLARSPMYFFLIGSAGNWIMGFILLPFILISMPFWFDHVYRIQENSPHPKPPLGYSPIPIWICILGPIFGVGVLLAILLYFR